MENKDDMEIFRPDSAPGWQWTLAFLCWLTAVYTMYHVEHSIYAGVVKTNTFSLALLPLPILLAPVFRDDEKAEKTKAKKCFSWFIAAIILAAAVFCLIFFWERNYIISLCQMGFACLTLLLPKHLQKTDSPMGILTFYALLTIGTLTAPHMAGYTSVAEAAEILQEQGYSDITFQQTPHGRMIADDMPDSYFLPEEWENPIYLFSAEKDGEFWAAAVSPVRGVIIGETPAPEGSEIEFWLRMH